MPAIAFASQYSARSLSRAREPYRISCYRLDSLSVAFSAALGELRNGRRLFGFDRCFELVRWDLGNP